MKYTPGSAGAEANNSFCLGSLRAKYSSGVMGICVSSTLFQTFNSNSDCYLI